MSGASLPAGAWTAAVASLLLVALLTPAGLAALSCTGVAQFDLLTGGDSQEANCTLDYRCYDPEHLGTALVATDPSCDPHAGACPLQLRVTLEYPGNAESPPPNGNHPLVFWFDTPTLPPENCVDQFCPTTIGVCGLEGAPQITSNRIDTYVGVGSYSCRNPGSGSAYSLRAYSCPALTGCRKVLEVTNLAITPGDVRKALGCPPPDSCGEEDEKSCRTCRPGGVSAGGGPPGFGGAGGGGGSFPGSGPGAFLWYRGGGAGHPGLPGTAEWNTTLGRYWSHSYAERIVESPDASHVWLITRYATFREYSDPDGSGVYQTVSPSDEVRTLRQVGPGWELEELDGTVHTFNSGGRWTESVDRHGNATVATYSADQLVQVSFPDGRHEELTYYPAGDPSEGKLESITEVGVDGVTSRTWTYTWSQDDLVRLDRPDGVAFELTYGDVRYPGYLTLLERVGTDDSRRVERGWVYDAQGNVIDTWRGATTATDPNAVDRWQLAFDDPLLPAVATLTDPLGNVSTLEIGRDEVSTKAKLLSITGDCPSCGLGPNGELAYDDAAHPLRATQEVDGEGHITLFAYDAHGQVTSRTEAATTALERTTTWDYHATYPALPTLISRPSVAGGATRRETALFYDAGGALSQRTESGSEAGAAFAYTTEITPNSAGQPLSINPPGYGTADATSFTYDPARGDLIPETRTDALIGTTTFAYDAYNRRIGVTDPNGVLTETRYDALDRLTHTIQRSDGGSSPGDPILPADLVTEYLYNAFGDLERTVLPAGNVIAYGYDAAGRLVSIERKSDAATPGERTVYQLDAAGNRTREEQQRWDVGAAAWVTEAATDYQYSARCQLDRVVQAPGSPEEAITDYAYDCNGNLTRVWDAAHPMASHPPTQVYTHDELDRLISVSQPWAGAGDAVTSYGYDVQDHLVQVTDAEGNATAYAYSDRDLLTQEVSPVSGTTTTGYNEHGELVSRTDARGVTETRTVDALDRVTFVDYADDTLDVATTYDAAGTCAANFPVGRLTSISRNGASVDYCYDRYGRTIQDGELTYSYDANGNRITISYPGEVSATTTYDFADRPETLTAQVGTEAAQDVVTGATYLPSGPLTELTLGNGLAESRSFDGRYAPEGITVSPAPEHGWTYTTDPLGNPTQIAETYACPGDLLLSNETVTTTQAYDSCAAIQAGPAFAVQAPGDVTFLAATRVVLKSGFSVGTGARFQAGVDPSLAGEIRTYAYQDTASFLTGANDASGSWSWTYDRIGNRLSETRVEGTGGGATDTYLYGTNGAGGNTPQLEEVSLAVGGSRITTYGAAGHLEEVAAGANVIDLTTDEAGRLARLDRAGEAATFAYDGRGFLTRAEDLTAGSVVQPLYSSDGLLHALFRQPPGGAPEERTTVFYLAGRPVAQLLQTDSTATWTYLTTDHLGTPLLATDPTGAELWNAAFEPFGRDPWQGTLSGALEAGIFLRFPGQWDDETWHPAALGSEVYYNVWRWLEVGTGRYTRPDPLGLAAGQNVFSYVKARPSVLVDPTGLQGVLVSPQDLTEAVDRACAQGAFARNFADLLRANWRFSDGYFHCKANCEAAQCGPPGEEFACVVSDLRELSDRLFKGDTPFEIASDQSANRFGRDQGRASPNTSCKILCSAYRPLGLPEEF